MPFDPEEAQYLKKLEKRLRQVERWPIDSPLAFVLHLASRTRGRLGEMFLDEIGVGVDTRLRPSGSPDFDRAVICHDRTVYRIETKFSTEDPPRFQQVRDPRLEGGALKYEYLVCLSGRPDGMVYWVFSAADLGDLMDRGTIRVQHAMSDTKWFFPLRSEQDAFSGHRLDYNGFKSWLRSLCP